MTTPTVESVFAHELREEVSEINDASSPANLSSWDSFNNVRLIIAIEEAFGVSLTSTDIESMKSVGLVKELLRKKGVAV